MTDGDTSAKLFMNKHQTTMKTVSFCTICALLIGAVHGLWGADSELKIVRDVSPLERDSAFTPHSYATMLKQATPAVVSVHTAKIVKVVQSRGYSPQEDFLRRFFGLPTPHHQPQQAQPQVEERKLPQGIGSGVIISKDGYIVTNNHVVSDERGEDADEVLVMLNDGRELHADIVGRDVSTDVALLKVDADDLPVLQIADSDLIEVGDIVFAIGNPMQVGVTVTQGIVSATGRSIGIYGERGYENFIQTDASINPGNSGGALIDTKGRLIGINSAIISRTGGNIGIGFAIPSNLALNIARQLNKFGEVRRGFMGVNISDLTPDMAEAFGVDHKQGVVVDKVEPDFPAAKAGVKRGDVIIAIDGKPVKSANELRVRVGQTPPGTVLNLAVIREGIEQQFEVEVSDVGAASLLGDSLFAGVQVSPLAKEERDAFSIPENISGLVITAVDPTSPFSRYFREGMVIMEINDRKVSDLNNARGLLSQGVNKLYVYDRGRLSYLAVRQ